MENSSEKVRWSFLLSRMHRKKIRRWPKLLALTTVLTGIFGWLVSPAVQATSTDVQTSCVDNLCTVNFPFSQSVYSWQPPENAIDVTFQIFGGQGGGDAGGNGGRVTGKLSGVAWPVQIRTGGAGSVGDAVAGGHNGGGAAGIGSLTAGSGGGATDIRTSDDLTTRIAIAAGGGGQGANGTGNGTRGGGGGGYLGLAGYSNVVYGGGGATQARAGFGGFSENGGGTGGHGSRGFGGSGGAVITAGFAGGGGGAGYYGGGGGAANGDSAGTGGTGGGGGSSYVNTSFVTDFVHSNSTNFGDGYAIISYQLQPAQAVVEPTPSASPEPTAEPTPSASPAAEPTAEATQTPIAQPEPTATASPNPTLSESSVPVESPASTSSVTREPEPQAVAAATPAPSDPPSSPSTPAEPNPPTSSPSMASQPDPAPSAEPAPVSSSADDAGAEDTPQVSENEVAAYLEGLRSINAQIIDLAAPVSGTFYRQRYEPQNLGVNLEEMFEPVAPTEPGVTENSTEYSTLPADVQAQLPATAEAEVGANWLTVVGPIGAVVSIGMALLGLRLLKIKLGRLKPAPNLANQLKITVR